MGKPGEGEEGCCEVFDRVGQAGKYERTYTTSHLPNILAMYKERFVFVGKEGEVKIIDVNESKAVGRFGQIDGEVKHAEVRENLLLLISRKENTDYFHFIVLQA